MTRAIWKFEMKITDMEFIDMPKGAEVLKVQVQDGIPCIWAIVNPDNEKETRTFRWIGTGHKHEDQFIQKDEYIGTVQIMEGRLVFHLFERRSE